MKKKVAILYSGARNWGGVEAYLLNFLSRDNEKIDFVLISMGEWDLTDKLSNKAKVFVIPAFRANPFLPVGIANILKKEKIDIVLSQGVLANFYARFTSIFSRKPHVCIVHSDIAIEYSNIFVKNFYIFTDIALRWKTKKYICVSEYLKNRLVSRGIESNKIEIIYNGSEPAKKSIDKKKTKNKIIIGSVGRLEYVKGFDVLVEAAKLIPENFEIRICGEGVERDNLEKIIEKNNLSNKVSLIGFCEDTEDFYSGLDVYVQPSRAEGFGLTVVDAMLRDIPVIVSDRGALPELVENKRTGIIFSDYSPEGLAKVIKYATIDVNNLSKYALSAKKVAKEKFGVERWYKELVKSINEVEK